MLASYLGPVKAVQELLAKGADVNAKTVDGKTAINYAKMGGHDEIETVLVKAGSR
jgi:ankyrin repeat protein